MSGVLTSPDLVRPQATDEALTTAVGAAAAAGERGGGLRPRRAAARLDDQLASIDVVAPSSLTLSSADGTLGATVVNGLDQPVTVQVRAADRRHARGRGVRACCSLGPGDRSRLLLDVSASRLGIHEVRLLVTDQDGTPLGGAAALPVRSAQVSAIIWYILVLGAVLLFGTILVRVVRQVRERRRAGEPAARATGRGDDVSDTKLLSATAVMASGTILSRFSGYFRTLLIVAALGQALHADIFTIANTIPNAVYILVAGGVFNAVLVPQLVRSMKNDPDGGDAYAARIITLSAIFLAVVTVILVLAAPLAGADLPVGRLLPARPRRAAGLGHRLHPLLPAAGLLLRDVRPGRPGAQRPAAVRPDDVGADRQQPRSPSRCWAATCSCGAPPPPPSRSAPTPTPRSWCSASAPRWASSCSSSSCCPTCAGPASPTARASTSAAPAWATRCGSACGPCSSSWSTRSPTSWSPGWRPSGTVNGGGTGNTVYSSSFLIMMVPHAIITVSLTTAILPRLSGYATDARLGDMGRTLGSTLRTALVVVLPFAALVPILARDIAGVLFDAGAGDPGAFAPTLAVFGPALVFFTVHYMMLRGFYALEQTRLVFFIQCAISATNIVVAVLLVGRATAVQTAPALVVAWLASYVVGSAISYTVLRRTLGGLDRPRRCCASWCGWCSPAPSRRSRPGASSGRWPAWARSPGSCSRCCAAGSPDSPEPWPSSVRPA